MTSFQAINDAFLSKILEDEWETWEEEEMKEDWKSLLLGALPWFKFPKHSLEYNEAEECFVEDLDQKEIQILANYMKCEWLNRTIMTWENVKPLYEERDFSQANLLKSFESMLEKEEKKTKRLESVYYRSRENKPFDFTKLASNP